MKIKNKYISLYFIIIICIFSLFNNYNARLIDSVYYLNFYKQLIFYIIGFIIIYLFKYINLNILFKYHYIYYILSLILLITVLLIGSEINGSRAWFNLYFFSLQPSEVMKLSLSITLSKLAYDFNISEKKYELLFLLKIFLLTFIPSILVFIEPDTGAIIFYLIIFLVTFFNLKIHKYWKTIFIIISILLTLTFIYLYIFEKNLLINIFGTSLFYRFDRIINFKDNYQINNALILIASSTLFGVGLSKSNLYVPESPTDFIYTYNIGNFGILACTTLTISYYLLFITLLNKNKKVYNKIFNNIFISLLLFQTTYNIFINIGLLPIMGIPLPYFSYGGSSIIIYFIFLGIYYKSINSSYN